MQRVSYSANLIYQVSERMVGIIGRQVLVSMIRLLQLFQLAFMFLPDCETSATGPTTNKCSKSGMWVGGEGRRFTLANATAWSLESGHTLPADGSIAFSQNLITRRLRYGNIKNIEGINEARAWQTRRAYLEDVTGYDWRLRQAPPLRQQRFRGCGSSAATQKRICGWSLRNSAILVA